MAGKFNRSGFLDEDHTAYSTIEAAASFNLLQPSV